MSEVDTKLHMDTLRRLLPVLRAHHVETVNVHFDGYGDSGSIDNIEYYAKGSFDPKAVKLVYETESQCHKDGKWIWLREPVEGSVNDAIEYLTYDYLEETGADWYNNDGGFGELIIDVIAGTVYLDVSVRYTDVTSAYSAEHEIETGEEV